MTILLAGGFCSSRSVCAEVFEVMATVETDPVPHAGDRADDAAVWLHPTDPNNSVIIGTDKDDTAGGLAVYDLAGRQICFATGGKMNNVDVRYNFPVGGEKVDIIAVGTETLPLSEASRQKLAQLTKTVHIRVFVTPTCPYCPRTVHIAHMLAIGSDNITADMVMAPEFPHLQPLRRDGGSQGHHQRNEQLRWRTPRGRVRQLPDANGRLTNRRLSSLYRSSASLPTSCVCTFKRTQVAHAEEQHTRSLHPLR